jgi:cobalt-zinc-cadmium efflux system outer membrane protein
MYRAHARLVSARERYELNQVVWKEWEVGQRSLSRQQAQLQKLWEAGELSSTDYLVQIGQSLDVQENALDLQESLWRAWFEWLAASGRIDKWIDLGEKS